MDTRTKRCRIALIGAGVMGRAHLDCIERGIATLIEKPVSDSIEGAIRLLDALLAAIEAMKLLLDPPFDAK